MAVFSFKDVEDAWVKEKTSRGLSDLPEEFYKDVVSYVAELRREAERGDEIRRDLFKAELQEALRMVQETHVLRSLKAVEDTVKGKFPAPLLQQEHYAFDEIRQTLEKLRDELVAPAVDGKAALAAPHEVTNMALLINAKIPQIIGDDLKPYGPFESGDAANLPRRSAELLVNRGLARELVVKGL